MRHSLHPSLPLRSLCCSCGEFLNAECRVSRRRTPGTGFSSPQAGYSGPETRNNDAGKLWTPVPPPVHLRHRCVRIMWTMRSYTACKDVAFFAACPVFFPIPSSLSSRRRRRTPSRTTPPPCHTKTPPPGAGHRGVCLCLGDDSIVHRVTETNHTSLEHYSCVKYARKYRLAPSVPSPQPQPKNFASLFPKIFLVVSGGNGAVMRTHGLIRDAIGNYINIDPTGFTLGTPPTAANGTSPSLWLAADIPDQLSQAILDACIISSSGVTLFAIPYDMPVSGFVGIFAGFTLPNTVRGANAARDLIRTTIGTNSEISQFVQTHRDAFGPQVSAGQAWDFFRDSITVHGIVLLVNDTNTVAWRLHVTPPTNDRAAWGQLRRLFGKLQIMTALYGTARLQPQ